VIYHPVIYDSGTDSFPCIYLSHARSQSNAQTANKDGLKPSCQTAYWQGGALVVPSVLLTLLQRQKSRAEDEGKPSGTAAGVCSGNTGQNTQQIICDKINPCIFKNYSCQIWKLKYLKSCLCLQKVSAEVCLSLMSPRSVVHLHGFNCYWQRLQKETS